MTSSFKSNAISAPLLDVMKRNYRFMWKLFMNSKKSCATPSDHTAEGGWETCIGVLWVPQIFYWRQIFANHQPIIKFSTINFYWPVPIDNYTSIGRKCIFIFVWRKWSMASAIFIPVIISSRGNYFGQLRRIWALKSL